uniref:Uncharacterized protein n=1 Tax=Parascaris equorum TaxID=6256 RepID=A0A914SJZ9_PAREQ
MRKQLRREESVKEITGEESLKSYPQPTLFSKEKLDDFRRRDESELSRNQVKLPPETGYHSMRREWSSHFAGSSGRRVEQRSEEDLQVAKKGEAIFGADLSRKCIEFSKEIKPFEVDSYATEIAPKSLGNGLCPIESLDGMRTASRALSNGDSCDRQVCSPSFEDSERFVIEGGKDGLYVDAIPTPLATLSRTSSVNVVYTDKNLYASQSDGKYSRSSNRYPEQSNVRNTNQEIAGNSGGRQADDKRGLQDRKKYDVSRKQNFLLRLNFFAERLTEKIAEMAVVDLTTKFKGEVNPRALYFSELDGDDIALPSMTPSESGEEKVLLVIFNCHVAKNVQEMCVPIGQANREGHGL